MTDPDPFDLAAEKACQFAIRAYREGESRTFVEGVIKCLVGA